MKNRLSILLAGFALGAGLLGAGTASAQGTWDLSSTCSPSGNPGVASCSIGSVTATMTAWSNTNGGKFAQANLDDYDPNGFGAYSGSNEGSRNGHHAFDNMTSGCGTSTNPTNSGCGGSVEAMLINFGSAKLSLDSIRIGWDNGEGDMSIWRWDGADPADMATTMTGITANTGATTLTSYRAALAGWTLVSSADLDITNPFGTGNNQYSSYFLVTTYFGAANNLGGSYLDRGNDAFKIKAFTASCAGGGCTPSTGVPEPASLALVAAALLGLSASRRRFGRSAH